MKSIQITPLFFNMFNTREVVATESTILVNVFGTIYETRSLKIATIVFSSETIWLFSSIKTLSFSFLRNSLGEKGLTDFKNQLICS